MTPLFIIFVLPSLVLALPALKRRPPWGYFMAVFVSFIGIILPLFVFVLSGALVPDWKGGATHGWIDCFHQGKFVLGPLVLWATVAFYAVEICHVKNRT